MRPLTLAEILARRPVTPSPGGTVSGMPSSSTGSLFTLGTPPPKRVLTIVSWNVQVFTPGKAEANPYVNVIIGKTLEYLGVDLCILLETKENQSVNLAAVEHRLANPVSNANLAVPTEEEWDEEELMGEERERLKALKVLDITPVGYQMIGSALTGKRYKPPKRIYLYGNPEKFFPKFLKSYANGAWKAVYAEYKPLHVYYAVFSQSGKAEIDFTTVPPQDEADVELRLRHCADCGNHLGNGGCETCAWSAEEEPFLTAVRQTVERFAFSLGGVQLETYGVLVRPSSIGIDGTGGLVYFDDKFGAVDVRSRRLASSGIGDRAPAEIIGEAQGKLSCPVTGAVDPATQFAAGQFQTLKGLPVTNILDPATLAALGVAMQKNIPLGYQVDGTAYYGRSPFIVPLLVRINGTDARVPVIAFHAPYGKENEEALNARGDSVVAIDSADVGGLTPVSAYANAVIIGDLNLDTAASPTTKDGRSAKRAYDELARRGFAALTLQVKSSLIALANSSWKKQKMKSKYDGAPWRKVTGGATVFVSSAYDNVLVKGPLQTKVVTGAIVDVIDLIQSALGTLDLTEARSELPEFDSLQPDQQAYFIYHAYVSDHLPVLLDIEIDPQPPDFGEVLEAEALQRRIKMESEVQRHFELTGTIVRVMTLPIPSEKMTLGGHTVCTATMKSAVPANKELATVTVDFNGVDEQYGVPLEYAQNLLFGDKVLIAAKEDRIASIAMRVVEGIQHFRGLAGNAAIVVGQVKAHSRDSERFRLVAAQMRCTIPRLPGQETLPPIGTTLLIYYTGAVLTPVNTRPGT